MGVTFSLLGSNFEGYPGPYHHGDNSGYIPGSFNHFLVLRCLRVLWFELVPGLLDLAGQGGDEMLIGEESGLK